MRQSFRWFLSLPALSFLLSSCTEAGPPRWTVAVDTLSNGAVHVVNAPPAGEEEVWRLEEVLRIGTVDEEGPSSFGQVRGLAVTRSGEIVVLDAQAKELRVFSPSGEHLATYGRQGAGPGEMEAPFGLVLAPDDRLWVPDHATSRMSVFSARAGFETSYPLRIYSYGWVWGGVMADDGRVLEPSVMAPPDWKPALRVYDAGMRQLDSIPLPEPPETADPTDLPNVFAWAAPGGRARGGVQVPFYPQQRDLLDPEGVFWSVDRGDGSYRIKRWTPGGDTTLVLETRRAPVPVTAPERDSAMAEILEGLEQFGVTKLDASKIPDTKPAVASVFLAEDGKLWVETPAPDSLHLYDVYDRAGRHVMTVATSLRIDPWIHPLVRGDTVWALVKDELDVTYVVKSAVATRMGGSSS